MKLVTFEHHGAQKLGLLRLDKVGDLAAMAGAGPHAACCRDMLTFLAAGDAAIAAAKELGETAAANHWLPLRDVTLKAPIARPGKIICLAGNYAAHIREGGLPVSEERTAPNLFIKPATCIIGPDETIRLPGPICAAVDYEAELGVVIGKTCKYVAAERALDHVAGYLNFNDISGRQLNIDLPREPTPRTPFFDWLNGKWFDTFGPTGPWLALKDEIPDPQALDLELSVNGELRQKASTADMIWGAAETVAWVSQFVTLEPGDIIATGTPSGVGSASKKFLQPGDIVEMRLTGLGVLRNRVGAP